MEDTWTEMSVGPGGNVVARGASVSQCDRGGSSGAYRLG